MITHWLEDERKVYVKTGLLLMVSYFFVGISEGAFFFQNGIDSLFNFVFTLVCVASNWLLFKWLCGWLLTGQMPLFIRTVRQVSVIILLAIFTTSLNWVYIEWLWRENLVETLFFPVVLPLAIVLFFVWAFGYHLLVNGYTKEPRELILALRKGQQKVLRPVSQIMGFWVEHKLVFAFAENGERLLTDQTLGELEDQLKEEGFFRVNRQMLLRREAINAYRTTSNERLELTLDESLKDRSPCGVSRYKAPAFRKWVTH